MDLLNYSQDTKEFSILKFNSNSDIKKFEPAVTFECDLAKALRPQVLFTSFKWAPLPGIYDVESKAEKDKLEKIYNKLKTLIPEVPVIRAKYFQNAALITGLDDLVKKYGDRILTHLCKEWGMDETEFKNKLTHYMIIVGDRFAHPSVLAHEYGHYLCQVGRGVEGGLDAHGKYAVSKIINHFEIPSYFIRISSVILARIQEDPMVLEGGLALDSIYKAVQLYYGKYIIKAEKCASDTGLKLLSDSGCSPEDLKLFELNLNGALQTYITSYRWNTIKKLGVNAILGGAIGAASLLFSDIKSNRKVRSKKSNAKINLVSKLKVLRDPFSNSRWTKKQTEDAANEIKLIKSRQNYYNNVYKAKPLHVLYDELRTNVPGGIVSGAITGAGKGLAADIITGGLSGGMGVAAGAATGASFGLGTALISSVANIPLKAYIMREYNRRILERKEAEFKRRKYRGR